MMGGRSGGKLTQYRCGKLVRPTDESVRIR